MRREYLLQCSVRIIRLPFALTRLRPERLVRPDAACASRRRFFFLMPTGSDQPQRPPRSGGGGGESARQNVRPPRRCGGSACRGVGRGILADADAVGRDRVVMVVVVIGGWAVTTGTRNEDR